METKICKRLLSDIVITLAPANEKLDLNYAYMCVCEIKTPERDSYLV